MADIISYLYKIVDKASPVLKDIEKQSERVNKSLLSISKIKYPTRNLSALNNELKKIKTESARVDKSLLKMSRVKYPTRNLTTFNNQLKKVKAESERVNKSLSNISKIKYPTRNLSAFGNQLRKTRAQSKNFDVNRNAFQNAIQGAKRFRGEMRQSLNSVARLNRDIYALSVGAVGGGTTSSIHRSLMEVSEYEKVLARVKSLAGDTANGQTISLLNDEAMRVMQETPFALQDISNGINVLMKNGVQATDITNGYLDAIAKFSTVAEADFGKSADLATDVMALFKDEGLSIHEVMNTLAAGMYSSKFDFQQFKMAVARGGSEAANAGMKFRDYVEAIAATSNAHVSGMTAGTSFAWMLRDLVKPTNDLRRKMLETAGVEIFNPEGNLKSASEIAIQLRKIVTQTGISQEQLEKLVSAPPQAMEELAKQIPKAEKLQAIFEGMGSTAAKSALPLLAMTNEEFEKLSEKMDAVNLDELTSISMTGYSGAIKELQSARDALKVALFGEEVTGGIFESLVRKVTKQIQILTEYVKENSDEIKEKLNKIIESIMAFLSGIKTAFSYASMALSTVASVITMLTGETSGASDVLNTMLTVLGLVAGSYLILTPILMASSAAFKALNVVFKAFVMIGRALMATPIMLLIMAVAAGAYLIYKNWEPIKEFFTKLWDDISSNGIYAWELFQIALEGTIQFLKDKFNGFINVFLNGVNKLIEASNKLGTNFEKLELRPISSDTGGAIDTSLQVKKAEAALKAGKEINPWEQQLVSMSRAINSLPTGDIGNQQGGMGAVQPMNQAPVKVELTINNKAKDDIDIQTENLGISQSVKPASIRW